MSIDSIGSTVFGLGELSSSVVVLILVDAEVAGWVSIVGVVVCVVVCVCGIIVDGVESVDVSMGGDVDALEFVSLDEIRAIDSLESPVVEFEVADVVATGSIDVVGCSPNFVADGL